MLWGHETNCIQILNYRGVQIYVNNQRSHMSTRPVPGSWSFSPVITRTTGRFSPSTRVHAIRVRRGAVACEFISAVECQAVAGPVLLQDAGDGEGGDCVTYRMSFVVTPDAVRVMRSERMGMVMYLIDETTGRPARLQDMSAHVNGVSHELTYGLLNLAPYASTPGHHTICIHTPRSSPRKLLWGVSATYSASAASYHAFRWEYLTWGERATDAPLARASDEDARAQIS